MTFSDLTNATAHLRSRVIQKEAGLISGTAKVVAAPLKAGYRASVRGNGKVMAPLMFGGAVLGTGAVAKKAIGQTRTYNRGFDPRIQAASMQQVS